MGQNEQVAPPLGEQKEMPDVQGMVRELLTELVNKVVGVENTKVKDAVVPVFNKFSVLSEDDEDIESGEPYGGYCLRSCSLNMQKSLRAVKKARLTEREVVAAVVLAGYEVVHVDKKRKLVYMDRKSKVIRQPVIIKNVNDFDDIESQQVHVPRIEYVDKKVVLDVGYPEMMVKTSVWEIVSGIVAFLSGNHGEWTISDDVKGGGKKAFNKFLKDFGHGLGIKGSAGTVAARGVKTGVKAYKKQAALMRQPAEGMVGSGDYNTGAKITKGHGRGFGGGKKGGSVVKVGERGEMRIRHSESLGDLISTTGGFVSQNYALNPGQSGTFPWLANVAANFQEFAFNKLVFELKTEVSNAQSSSTGAVLSMGMTGAATQYNAAATPFVNKQQCENSDYSTAKRPGVSWSHAIEVKKRFTVLNEQYVRTGSVPAGTDIRMYDLGFTQVWCNNVPTNSVATSLGEIWVHYDIVLRKPLQGYQSSIGCSRYYGVRSGTSVLFPVMSAGANNAQVLTINPANIQMPLNIEYGLYIFIITMSPGSASNFVWPTITTANCTLVQMYNNGSEDSGIGFFAPSSGVTTSGNVAIIFTVSVNAPGSALAQINFSGGTYPTNTFVDLYMAPWNINMTT